jgi:hypothetical protein
MNKTGMINAFAIRPGQVAPMVSMAMKITPMAKYIVDKVLVFIRMVSCFWFIFRFTVFISLRKSVGLGLGMSDLSYRKYRTSNQYPVTVLQWPSTIK